MLRRASNIVSAGWLATIGAYFLLAPLGMTWGYAVINLVQAIAFWRASGAKLFPLPLFMMSAVSIVINLLATLSAADFWWSSFELNRLFDLTLLYIAGCALYRIVRRRQKMKGAPMARPYSADVFAAA